MARSHGKWRRIGDIGGAQFPIVRSVLAVFKEGMEGRERPFASRFWRPGKMADGLNTSPRCSVYVYVFLYRNRFSFLLNLLFRPTFWVIYMLSDLGQEMERSKLSQSDEKTIYEVQMIAI